MARYRSLDRKHFHDTFNGGYLLPKTHQAFHRGMDTVFNVIDAIAKEASPPAPVAQEKLLVCGKCGAPVTKDFDDGRCLPGVHGVEADGHDLADPKPPEVEEPAIVQRLRGIARDTPRVVGWRVACTLDFYAVEQLLAFIDSRKAAKGGM